jgi:hypothetical protein
MNLPNLLVIGAMKSGTTSLHYYLGLHPQIFMSRRKELDFFVQDRNWARGVPWYASQFPDDAQVRGETSPRYALHPVHAGVPQRIHELIPAVKMLYLVRDPVERLISHYMHDVIEGNEARPLEQILDEEPENHYVLASRYWLQLQEYRSCFPTDRILIIRQEDLLERRRETLQAVFRFVGVDAGFESSRITIERHRTNRKRRLTPAGRALQQAGLKNMLVKLPAPVRGYAEWITLYPFSRAVPRYKPSLRCRQELEALFKDETARVLATFQVARP